MSNGVMDQKQVPFRSQATLLKQEGFATSHRTPEGKRGGGK